MVIPVLSNKRFWECPSCAFQHVTDQPGALTPMHPCPGHAGVEVPLVGVQTNAGLRRGMVRHVVAERGDMIGTEFGVRHDSNGRAVQAVITERADGSNDTHVFAPTANASFDIRETPDGLG